MEPQIKYYIEANTDIVNCARGVYGDLVSFLKAVIHNEQNTNIYCTISEEAYQNLRQHPSSYGLFEKSYSLITNSFNIAGVECKIVDTDEIIMEVYLSGKKTKHFCNLKEV